MGGPFAKVPSPSCLQQYLYLYSYLYLHLYLNLYFVFSPWVGAGRPPRAKMPFSCLQASSRPSFMPTAHTANALGSQFEFMPSYCDQTMSDAQQLLHFLDVIALLYVHNFCIAAQPWSSQCMLIVDATLPLLLDFWVGVAFTALFWGNSWPLMVLQDFF